MFCKNYENAVKKEWMIMRENSIKESALKILYLLAATVILTILFALTGANAENAYADQLDLTFSSTDGSACTNISDDSYMTTEYFDPGTEITLTSDTAINSLYIRWEYIPGEWTLRINGNDYTFGEDGYLHEYVEIPTSEKGATSVTLVIGSSQLTIADIYAFSEGTLPDFVQIWEPSYEEADALFISTHADDEILFFGGLIATLINEGNVRVQVAYLSDLFQTELYRNHEILNGLWKMGVTHYPQLGEFADVYSESLEEAETQYDYDSCLEYIVRTIRRFKPQIVIGQDIENGEYGHGGHMFCAKLIADALDITADASQYPDSASKYGTWDVPKTYFHLYPENTIELDLRVPLAAFGGKTAYEMACEGYLEHQSQQWCWFYVSDGYLADGSVDYDHPEINCAKYGLYRTLVGADITGTSVLDNITTYDDQEKAAEEAAKAQAAALESESTEAEAANASSDSVVDTNSKTQVSGGKNTTAITIFSVLALLVLAMIIGLLVVSKSQAKIRAKERKLEKDIRKAKGLEPGSRSRNKSTGMRSRGQIEGNRKQGRRPSAYPAAKGSAYAAKRSAQHPVNRSTASSRPASSGRSRSANTSRNSSGYNSRSSNGSYGSSNARAREIYNNKGKN